MVLPRVLVVNNYPTRERVTRLESCVEGNGATVTSAEWNAASAGKFDRFDGVVLSGSPDIMTDSRTRAKFEAEADAIRDSAVPILGVCFGHQLMASAFGAPVVKDKRHVLDMVRTRVLAEDSLFEGLPRALMLLESRYEVVKSLPGGFSLIAKSATSDIAAMKHESRLLYGVQFHPERFTLGHPEGNKIVGNFVSLLK
jgi:GMP synthase (glutamine-hydrolysing) A subunit